MKKIICIVVLVFVSMIVFAQKNNNELIRQAIQSQINTYPKSTLQDIYKNFFQDSFGLEHLMGDSLKMREYIIEETKTCQKTNTYYEKIGYKNNFYRVSLSVIKDSVVSIDVFMKAFMKSKDSFNPVTLDSWKKQWQSIDSIINSMNLNLDNYENDRKSIFSMLNNGSYAVHHSKQFNKYYHPHYRIIEKTAFETMILPYILKEQK
ncbi:MAG: hypothetical protein LKE30_07065 [Bacteroidales bacterium]|nr:hypothetical protein [Bacteroidales bacterium]